jgi:hypothetical protein
MAFIGLGETAQRGVTNEGVADKRQAIAQAAGGRAQGSGTREGIAPGPKREAPDQAQCAFRVVRCTLKKGAEKLKTESIIEIAIFPSGKLRRPEKKLKTSRGFWRGDGAEH